MIDSTSSTFRSIFEGPSQPIPQQKQAAIASTFLMIVFSIKHGCSTCLVHHAVSIEIYGTAPSAFSWADRIPLGDPPCAIFQVG